MKHLLSFSRSLCCLLHVLITIVFFYIIIHTLLQFSNYNIGYKDRIVEEADILEILIVNTFIKEVLRYVELY